MSDLIPAESWHRYGYALYPDQAWEVGDGTLTGTIAEPSIVHGPAGWQMWYNGEPYYEDLTPHIQGGGMGYATAPTILGPWTKYVRALALVTLVNPSFETDGGGGVATGWTLTKTVAGTPTTTLVAGRTGGNAQRIQYTLQAGDTGKAIWLEQTVAAGVARNEGVIADVWAKGAVTGGCAVCIEPVLAGSAELKQHAFTPSAGWVHIAPAPPLHVMSEAATGNVTVRIIRVLITSDTGSVDITIDDATLAHGITSPVKPARANCCVVRVGDTYHFFGQKWDTGIVQASSADGITWGPETTVVVNGGAGDWDTTVYNSRPFLDDDGLWYLYYEAISSTGTEWIGVAISSAITGPWTKYPGNPIIAPAGKIVCHPCVIKVGGQYLMYAHGSASDQVADPGNNVLRYAGGSPFNWTLDQDPVFSRVGADEGEGLARAQAADVSVYSDGYRYVMYYTANFDFDSTVAPSHTKMMVSDVQMTDTLPARAEAVIRDIAIFAEDTAPIMLTLPCDLSGCSVAWGMSVKSGQPLLVSAAAEIVDAAAGLCMVSLAAEETAGLAGHYWYEAEVTDSMGIIKTLLYGRLFIRPDTV